jgi:hypothetical protein
MKHHPAVRVGALILAAHLALSPLSALAQVNGDAGGEATVESVKFFDLAMCAISVAAIETGVGALAAVVTCGRAAYVWWST